MTKRRVLVTDAESRKALAVVRGLGDDFEIWTVSDSRIAMASWSRYAQHPIAARVSESEFAEWLLALAVQNGIEVILASQEKTLVLLSQTYDEFVRAGVQPGFPPYAVLETAFDKAQTLAAAQRVGIRIPKTVVPQTIQEIEAAADTLQFPVVLKYRHSYYWDGQTFHSSPRVQYAATRDELTGILKTLDAKQPPPMLQEFVPGEGIGIFLLMDRRGEVCAAFAHERMQDILPTGGASVVRKSVAVDERLLEASTALLREMNWWGVAMVEFRRDARDGHAVLMEVNGRFWGSLQLAIDAGVNFPRLLVEVALGETSTRPRYREGVISQWRMGQALRLAAILQGRPRGYTGAFPGRWEGIKEFFTPVAGALPEVRRKDDAKPAVAEALAQTVGRIL